MAYVPITPRIGLSSFTQIDTTPAYVMGAIALGEDSTLGAGEFIYLLGVASCVVGSVVTYNPVTGATTLAPNTANLGQPLAVAMSANTTTTAGSWFQVSGVSVVKKTAIKVSPNVAMFLSATIGRLMSTVASGKQVLNARSVNSATVASATSTVRVLLQRSFAQGQVV